MTDEIDDLFKLLPISVLSEMEIALVTLKEDLPAYKEFQAINATLTKNKYDLLVKEGFSPEQALELSKTL